MNSERGSRAVVWGAHSTTNTGDELTLSIAIHDLKRRGFDPVSVIALHPWQTQRFFQGVETLGFSVTRPELSRTERWSRRIARRLGYQSRAERPEVALSRDLALVLRDPPPWAKALLEADLLYLSGGGYLTDLFALQNFLLPVLVAHHAGIAIATAPIGLGPFREESVAQMVADALRGSDLRVRDKDSLQFCRERGLEVRLERDDVFRLGEIHPEWLERPAQTGHRLRIGLNPNRQPGAVRGAPIELWWSELTRGLASMEDVELGAFCFYTREDEFRQAVSTFADAGVTMERVHPPSFDYRENLRVLCKFDLIISSRFHALVVAEVLGMPHVGVASGEYYTRKMRAAMASGQAESLLVDPAATPPGLVLEFVARQLPDLAFKSNSREAP